MAYSPYRLQYPTGSYDPSLDSQLGAAARGLLDTSQDYSTQATRAATDYSLGVGQINTQYGRQQADLTTSRDRGYQDLDIGQRRTTEDIATQRQQGTEDYQRNLATLQRSYARLGGRQGQQITAGGASAGGALMQAAAKRAENQAWDTQPVQQGYERQMGALDTAGQRAGETYGIQRGRVGEDYTTGFGRSTEDQQTALGNLGLGYTRTTQDQTQGLERAQREAGYFGIDIDRQRAFQAGQSGFYS